MEITCAGEKATKQVKTATRSIHGVVIHSHYALYARADRQPLPLHEASSGCHGDRHQHEGKGSVIEIPIFRGARLGSRGFPSTNEPPVKSVPTV